MIDMKITDAERKKHEPMTALDDAPKYPYGLSLNIDSDTFKKLNMDVPKIGQKLKLNAMVEVSSINQYSNKDNSKDTNINIQICEMELIAGSKSSDDADVIYK